MRTIIQYDINATWITWAPIKDIFLKLNTWTFKSHESRKIKNSLHLLPIYFNFITLIELA